MYNLIINDLRKNNKNNNKNYNSTQLAVLLKRESFWNLWQKDQGSVK